MAITSMESRQSAWLQRGPYGLENTSETEDSAEFHIVNSNAMDIAFHVNLLS